MNMLNANAEKLMQDLGAVVTEAESLLQSGAGEAGAMAASARARVEASLGEARERMIELERMISARTSAAANEADRYVHENPWPVIGIAAGAGIALGFILGRR